MLRRIFVWLLILSHINMVVEPDVWAMENPGEEGLSLSPRPQSTREAFHLNAGHFLLQRSHSKRLMKEQPSKDPKGKSVGEPEENQIAIGTLSLNEYGQYHLSSSHPVNFHIDSELELGSLQVSIVGDLVIDALTRIDLFVCIAAANVVNYAGLIMEQAYWYGASLVNVGEFQSQEFLTLEGQGDFECAEEGRFTVTDKLVARFDAFNHFGQAHLPGVSQVLARVAEIGGGITCGQASFSFTSAPTLHESANFGVGYGLDLSSREDLIVCGCVNEDQSYRNDENFEPSFRRVQLWAEGVLAQNGSISLKSLPLKLYAKGNYGESAGNIRSGVHPESTVILKADTAFLNGETVVDNNYIAEVIRAALAGKREIGGKLVVSAKEAIIQKENDVTSATHMLFQAPDIKARGVFRMGAPVVLARNAQLGGRLEELEGLRVICDEKLVIEDTFRGDVQGHCGLEGKTGKLASGVELRSGGLVIRIKERLTSGAKVTVQEAAVIEASSAELTQTSDLEADKLLMKLRGDEASRLSGRLKYNTGVFDAVGDLSFEDLEEEGENGRILCDKKFTASRLVHDGKNLLINAKRVSFDQSEVRTSQAMMVNSLIHSATNSKFFSKFRRVSAIVNWEMWNKIKSGRFFMDLLWNMSDDPEAKWHTEYWKQPLFRYAATATLWYLVAPVQGIIGLANLVGTVEGMYRMICAYRDPRQEASFVEQFIWKTPQGPNAKWYSEFWNQPGLRILGTMVAMYLSYPLKVAIALPAIFSGSRHVVYSGRALYDYYKKEKTKEDQRWSRRVEVCADGMDFALSAFQVGQSIYALLPEREKSEEGEPDEEAPTETVSIKAKKKKWREEKKKIEEQIKKIRNEKKGEEEKSPTQDVPKEPEESSPLTTWEAIVFHSKAVKKYLEDTYSAVLPYVDHYNCLLIKPFFSGAGDSWAINLLTATMAQQGGYDTTNALIDLSFFNQSLSGNINRRTLFSANLNGYLANSRTHLNFGGLIDLDSFATYQSNVTSFSYGVVGGARAGLYSNIVSTSASLWVFRLAAFAGRHHGLIAGKDHNLWLPSYLPIVGNTLSLSGCNLDQIPDLMKQAGIYGGFFISDHVGVTTQQEVIFEESTESASSSFSLHAKNIKVLDGKGPEDLNEVTASGYLSLESDTDIELGAFTKTGGYGGTALIYKNGKLITRRKKPGASVSTPSAGTDDVGMYFIGKDGKIYIMGSDGKIYSAEDRSLIDLSNPENSQLILNAVQYHSDGWGAATIIGGRGIPYTYVDPVTGMRSTRYMGIYMDGKKFEGAGCSFISPGDLVAILPDGFENTGDWAQLRVSRSPTESVKKASFHDGTYSVAKLIIRSRNGKIIFGAGNFLLQNGGELYAPNGVEFQDIVGENRTDYHGSSGWKSPKKKKTVKSAIIGNGVDLTEKEGEKPSSEPENPAPGTPPENPLYIIAPKGDIKFGGVIYIGENDHLYLQGKNIIFDRRIMTQKAFEQGLMTWYNASVLDAWKSLNALQNGSDLMGQLNGEQDGNPLLTALSPSAYAGAGVGVRYMEQQVLGPGSIKAHWLTMMATESILQKNGYSLVARKGFVKTPYWRQQGAKLRGRSWYGNAGVEAWADKDGVDAGLSGRVGASWSSTWVPSTATFDEVELDVGHLNQAGKKGCGGLYAGKASGRIGRLDSRVRYKKQFNLGAWCRLSPSGKVSAGGSAGFSRKHVKTGVNTKEGSDLVIGGGDMRGATYHVGNANPNNGKVKRGKKNIFGLRRAPDLGVGLSASVTSQPNDPNTSPGSGEKRTTSGSVGGSASLEGWGAGYTWHSSSGRPEDPNKLFQTAGDFSIITPWLTVDGPLVTGFNGEAWQRFLDNTRAVMKPSELAKVPSKMGASIKLEELCPSLKGRDEQVTEELEGAESNFGSGHPVRSVTTYDDHLEPRDAKEPLSPSSILQTSEGGEQGEVFPEEILGANDEGSSDMGGELDPGFQHAYAAGVEDHMSSSLPDKEGGSLLLEGSQDPLSSNEPYLLYPEEYHGDGGEGASGDPIDFSDFSQDRTAVAGSDSWAAETWTIMTTVASQYDDDDGFKPRGLTGLWLTNGWEQGADALASETSSAQFIGHGCTNLEDYLSSYESMPYEDPRIRSVHFAQPLEELTTPLIIKDRVSAELRYRVPGRNIYLDSPEALKLISTFDKSVAGSSSRFVRDASWALTDPHMAVGLITGETNDLAGTYARDIWDFQTMYDKYGNYHPTGPLGFQNLSRATPFPFGSDRHIWVLTNESSTYFGGAGGSLVHEGLHHYWALRTGSPIPGCAVGNERQSLRYIYQIGEAFVNDAIVGGFDFHQNANDPLLRKVYMKPYQYFARAFEAAARQSGGQFDLMGNLRNRMEFYELCQQSFLEGKSIAAINPDFIPRTMHRLDFLAAEKNGLKLFAGEVPTHLGQFDFVRAGAVDNYFANTDRVLWNIMNETAVQPQVPHLPAIIGHDGYPIHVMRPIEGPSNFVKPPWYKTAPRALGKWAMKAVPYIDYGLHVGEYYYNGGFSRPPKPDEFSTSSQVPSASLGDAFVGGAITTSIDTVTYGTPIMAGGLVAGLPGALVVGGGMFVANCLPDVDPVPSAPSYSPGYVYDVSGRALIRGAKAVLTAPAKSSEAARVYLEKTHPNLVPTISKGIVKGYTTEFGIPYDDL